jgi:acyl-CoA thioester hydrolase
MRLADSGEIVCDAQTDWVFLNTATQRPIVIPPEMITAFYPEGLPEQKRTPDNFPESTPSAAPFTARRRPEFRDIDAAQHVNNAVYLDYFEDCARQDAARWVPEGVDLALRRCRIEYKVPARLGDDLDVSAWISDASATTVTRHFTLVRAADAALIGRAYSEWAWVEVATGRPIQVPADLASHLVMKE